MIKLVLIQKTNERWIWPSEPDEYEDPIDLCNRSLFATTPTAHRFTLDGWWMPVHTDCVQLNKRVL